MPRENGVNVLRKMREYGTNIVQTVVRKWREYGANVAQISRKRGIKKNPDLHRDFFAASPGLEPGTIRLTAERSTN